MLKRISAQRARQRFGELMDEVRIRGDRYVVERGRRPMVAIIPVEEYAAWERIKAGVYEKVKQIRAKNRSIDSEVLESEIREAVETAKQL